MMPTRYLFGISLFIGGFGTCYWAYREQIKIGNKVSFWKRINEDTQYLCTTGPYAYSRNPMTLGGIIGIMGTPFLMPYSGAYFIMELLPATVCMIGCGAYCHFYHFPKDEKSLEQKHGMKYLEYKSKVNRWFGRKL